MDSARSSAIEDPDRISAVCDTSLLDAPPHASFERLTRLASRLVRAPGVRVILMDAVREWVVSGTDLREARPAARQTPLAHSFCERVVASGAPFVVHDARRSPVLRDCPAVRQKGEVAYAGFPVRDGRGRVLGAFCAVDYQPHRWTADELEALGDFAIVAGEEMHRLILHHAEEELRFLGAPFLGLVEQSLVGIYVVQQGRFRYVNPRFAEIFGYTVQEVLGQGVPLNLVAEEDRDLVMREFEQGLRGQAPRVQLCFRGRRRDGATVHVEVQGVRTDFDGRPAVVGTTVDVTDQKRTDAALRDSEERYRHFFEDDVAAAFTTALDGTILDCNPAFLRVFGFDSSEQALGSSIVDLYPAPQDRQVVLQRLREHRRLELYEIDLRRRDGVPIHVIENLVGVFDEQGELSQVRSYVLDVTERHQALSALRESEERTRAILETAHDAFVAISADGLITDWNAQAERTFGWSRAEVVGRPLASVLIPPRFREAHRTGIQRFLATGEERVLNRRFEMPALHRAGHEFPMELTITPVRVGDSYIFTSFLHDVTERKHADAALRDSEEQLRLVERATNDVIWDWDLSSGRLLWNSAGPKRFRYAPAEVGCSVEWHVERVHPEDREHVVGGIHEAMGGVDDSWSEEYRFLRGDGSYATVLDRAYVVRNERGEPTRIIGSMMDVTERKRVEETQRFLARASALLDASLDVETTLNSLARLCIPTLGDYCLIDLAEEDGGVRRVARAHVDPMRERLLSNDEHHGPDADPDRHPVLKAVRTAAPVLVPELSDAVLDELAHDATHRAALREMGLCSFMIVPIVARERVLGAITLATSESKRRLQPIDLMVGEDLARRAALCIDNAQLYEKIRRAVQARDEVLGVVSHDLRNPLGAIIAAASVLSGHADSPEASKGARWIEIIQRSAAQMKTMIGDLLDVSSIEAGRFSLALAPYDVHRLAGEACEMLEPAARARQIRLECVMADGIPKSRIDAGQLMRVIGNLVDNALKFTPPDGSVTLRAEADGEWVHFSVVDTGPGLAPQQVARVFDRFWQAREGDHRGAGLGLTIARGIVEAHGGRIWVESTEGQGAAFHFTVPISLGAREGGSPPLWRPSPLEATPH